MIEWIWNWLLHTTLGFIPTWVWFIAGGLAIGWAFKTFGWQGVVGAVAAILTLGAYREGWRARDREARGTEHVADDSPDAVTPFRKPRVPTAKRAGKRKWNPDANGGSGAWEG